jgi:hypothetical protein
LDIVIKQENTFSYGLKALYKDLKLTLTSMHTQNQILVKLATGSQITSLTSSNTITNNIFQKQNTCIVTQKQSTSLKLVYFTSAQKQRKNA